MKITFFGAPLSANFGGPCLLVSTMKVLSNYFTGLEFTLMVPPNYIEADSVLSDKYNINVLPLGITKFSPFFALIKRFTGILLGSKKEKEVIKEIESSDIVIDIWGIIFTDSLGTDKFKDNFSKGLRLLVAKLLGKTVIKYTTDIGPLKLKWNRFFCKFYLSSAVDYIIVRNEDSAKELYNLRIKKPIFVSPDTAFVLDPIKSEMSEYYDRLRKKLPLIGVSVSFKAHNQVPSNINYCEIMSDFIKSIINKYRVKVVILPNDLSNSEKGDLKIAKQIHSKVGSTYCEIIDVECLTAQELKGVINEFDLLVAARYHTIVAALSLGKPTLAIGWHHKYFGILKLFNQEKYLCDVNELSLNNLINKFDNIWTNKEQIREEISNYIDEVKRKVYQSAESVYKFIQKNSNKSIETKLYKIVNQ